MHGFGRFAWYRTHLAHVSSGSSIRGPKTSSVATSIADYASLGFVVVVALAAIVARQPGWLHRLLLLRLSGDPRPHLLYLLRRLVACISPPRRWLWAPAVCLSHLRGLQRCITGPLRSTCTCPGTSFPCRTARMPCIAFAGITLTTIFFRRTALRHLPEGPSPHSFWPPSLFWRALHPLGILEDRATPTWCLYSIGATALLFTALLHMRREAPTRVGFLGRPQGRNPAALPLPDSGTSSSAPWASLTLTRTSVGALGVVRALVFTAFMLSVSLCS